jgi:hypothetical protein
MDNKEVSPYISEADQPIIKKMTEMITDACFLKKDSLFFANSSFSGITLIFSKAPAFSISLIVVFPITVSFNAPKFTLASETPSRCLTFVSNFFAQPAQVNPDTRNTVLLSCFVNSLSTEPDLPYDL